MKQNSIEFTLSSVDEAQLSDDLAALAILIANLNKNGVPYSLRRDSLAIQITIGTGF